jgi:hypothetical protein
LSPAFREGLGVSAGTITDIEDVGILGHGALGYIKEHVLARRWKELLCYARSAEIQATGNIL